LPETPQELVHAPLILVLDASAAVGEVLRKRGEALLTHKDLALFVAEGRSATSSPSVSGAWPSERDWRKARPKHSRKGRSAF